jgi:hypothetical protein
MNDRNKPGMAFNGAPQSATAVLNWYSTNWP